VEYGAPRRIRTYTDWFL